MRAVNWSEYAAVYDLMAENNPTYQELLAHCRGFLGADCQTKVSRVLDAGAGTGNFSLLCAQSLAATEVIHLEPNAGMNSRTRAKAQAQRLGNLTVLEQPVESTEFPAASFDLIISVHALYTMPQPQVQLRRFAGWLRPGGQAFLCDFGRTMVVADWRKFLFNHLRREKGLLRTLNLLWHGRQIAQQNQTIAQLQGSGEYWLHSPEEFRTAVEQSGLQIRKQALVYRGYSDLVIAQKI